MKNKFLIIGIMILLVGGVFAGIESGFFESLLSTEKKVPIDNTDYVELKSVLTEKNVIIDDKLGLDIRWEEKDCFESRDENSILIGYVCHYALYKENLFGGAEIGVSYGVKDTIEERQTKLDNAIMDKVQQVKNVWIDRKNNDDTISDGGVVVYEKTK